MADKILKELNGLPIFRMSLGSKELFHSNFLEYLWSVDSDRFKNMINKFYLEKICLFGQWYPPD